MSLPASGAVLGVDIGWSIVRPSSAVCRLDWTAATVAWTIRRFRATDGERGAAIGALADRPLLAAALDGSLRREFDKIGAYRHAERLLTLGFGSRIGKPGQSNTPNGRLLNAQANACAEAIAATGRIAAALHPQAIHAQAIVEAFPSAWLGMLIDAPEVIPVRRGDRSDRYYAHLAASGGLRAVVERLLPGRALAGPFTAVIDHDERAALVCALTALGLAAGDYVAAGDAQGWIILPPPALIRPWAGELLASNADRCGGGVEWGGARGPVGLAA
ncbi:hypothetical protein [uncultured Sphingomonas sp.]|uniref:hypothetical protein n=1 Tax=uncultured Sphingomonas sp. TaxID=158754 RepID=UPI0035CA88F2